MSQSPLLLLMQVPVTGLERGSRQVMRLDMSRVSERQMVCCYERLVRGQRLVSIVVDLRLSTPT